MRLVAVELVLALSSSSSHADGRRRGKSDGANVETNHESTFAHSASRTSGSWPRIVRLGGGAILLECWSRNAGRVLLGCWGRGPGAGGGRGVVRQALFDFVAVARGGGARAAAALVITIMRCSIDLTWPNNGVVPSLLPTHRSSYRLRYQISGTSSASASSLW